MGHFRKKALRVGLGAVIVAVGLGLVLILTYDGERARGVSQVSGIRFLLLACLTYAADDVEGDFPERLEDLYPDYMDNIDYPDSYGLDLKQVGEYIYFSGRKKSDSSRLILIVSPEIIGNHRAIGYVGGHVNSIKETEYQRLIAEGKNLK